MRTLTIALVSLGLAFTLSACGDDGGVKDMAAPDMAVPADLLPARDLAMPDFAGVSCGNMTCGASQECCAQVASGTLTEMCVAAGTCNADAGAAAVLCDGPEDCSGDAPPNGGCCATITGQLGNADAGTATAGNASASCVSKCPGNVTFDQGEGTFTALTKLCHVNADCAGYNGKVPVLGALKFDSCCSSGMAGPYKFCFSSTAASQTKGAIVCQ